MVVASPSLQEGQARALLKALADPLRLQVIEALGGGERCVCDLTADLGLAQSKLSFHLKVLKEAGLLADRHEGRWIYYSTMASGRHSIHRVHPDGTGDEVITQAAPGEEDGRAFIGRVIAAQLSRSVNGTFRLGTLSGS